MHSRAVLRCVLLSPLQIMIKMNLFCILGRLQGHRCQLCQIRLCRYWIILCFEHVLWMPCKYNTFDGRLLWFDGVEGKRGLTSTSFSFFAGGGGGGGQTVSLYSAYSVVFMAYPVPLRGPWSLFLRVPQALSWLPVHLTLSHEVDFAVTDGQLTRGDVSSS